MNYYYLVSSLPMINLNQNAGVPITLERLNELCRENLTAKDLEIYESIDLTGEIDGCRSKVVQTYRIWDINLRNAILARRVENRVAAKYKKEELEFFSEIEGLIQEAGSKANALERELFLDELRIKKIDELTAHSLFDIEFLCAYKLKLILISKYSRLSADAGEEKFNELVDDIIKNSNITE